jgi:light-regulated signal transduction histidine kinase (bacteriophytochrome)
MDNLVQDLLEYARISRTQFELTRVDVQSLVQQVRSQMSADTEHAGASIEVVEPMPAVLANETLLSQVLANLLNNAMKFVAPGTKPRIKIEARRSGNRVRLIVSDNGIGIAPEYHGKIFRMFERLHSLSDYPGTGIGLTIVQKAVARMNGQVGLESSPGNGSAFWIELASPTA